MNMTYKDVSTVYEMIQSFLGNEKHFVKKKECSFLFHTLNPEGTFKNQFPKTAEIRTSPVQQQALNLLFFKKVTFAVAIEFKTVLQNDTVKSNRVMVWDYLQSDCMFLFPLHVIDVPGNCCHGYNGIFYHLIPWITFIKVFG